MTRETYPGGARAFLRDVVPILWGLAVDKLARPEPGRRGSHAATGRRRPRAPRSRAIRLTLVCLVPPALGAAVGGAYGLYLNGLDGAAGGQPTRPRGTLPVVKVVETSTGIVRPVPLPTSAYDGQAPSIEPDRRPTMQNPECWIGTPGWPHDC